MYKTVQNIIVEYTQSVAPLKHSVDRLEFGSMHQAVERIAVAFMPTYEIIKRCAQQKVDLLLCHEGLFYSHHTNKALLHDTVAQEKQRLK